TAGKAVKAAGFPVDPQASLLVAAVKRAEGSYYVPSFAVYRSAGAYLRFGQGQVFVCAVASRYHLRATSRKSPMSGLKINSTLPISPFRFLARVRSTARAGGVAWRSLAWVKKSTASAVYSRSPLSLSESRFAAPFPPP